MVASAARKCNIVAAAGFQKETEYNNLVGRKQARLAWSAIHLNRRRSGIAHGNALRALPKAIREWGKGMDGGGWSMPWAVPAGTRHP
jgi:hypothetical protein